MEARYTNGIAGCFNVSWQTLIDSSPDPEPELLDAADMADTVLSCLDNGRLLTLPTRLMTGVSVLVLPLDMKELLRARFSKASSFVTNSPSSSWIKKSKAVM